MLAVFVLALGREAAAPGSRGRRRVPRVDNVTTGDYFQTMKAVGIRQLKARLSEYVRLVKAGETILVTDRDEVVAELRPARRQNLMVDHLEEVLQGLADAGEVTRASVPKLDWTWRVKGLGLPAGTGQKLLDAVRADRSVDNA